MVLPSLQKRAAVLEPLQKRSAVAERAKRVVPRQNNALRMLTCLSIEGSSCSTVLRQLQKRDVVLHPGHFGIDTDMAEDEQYERKAAADALIAEGKARVRSIRPMKRKTDQQPDLARLRRPNESAADGNKRLRETSKRNLNALLEWKTATAEQVGVEGRWLKRFREEGLAYPSAASHENLEKLADFFGVPDFGDLWQDDLLQRMGLPGPTPKQVEEWKHSRYWKHAEMLLSLLDTGDYGHLAQLVENLHELELSRSSRQAALDRPAASKTIADIIKQRKNDSHDK